MAPGTRRRAIARNPFVAPSLLRDFDCSKMFFVCEDLLVFFERLKTAPGDEEFDDAESFVQYIQDLPTRTCTHSHMETCVVVLYLCLPDVAEILYPELTENVRQQLASYPRLSPRRFLQLLRFGELGDAFVSVMKSCRLVSRMESFRILFSREEFEALIDTQDGADDIVYFLRHAVKAALPGRIPLDLREYCRNLMTCEGAKLSIGLLLGESLAVIMNDVVETLSKSTRPGNFADPSAVVQKMFKPAAASHEACGWNDTLEFLVGLLASAVDKDKRLCDEMMRLSINDKIVDFALNCCDAATEAGLINMSNDTRAHLTSLATTLAPFTLHVRRISGADSYDSLKMLKDAPKDFYRDAIFLELLRNRKTYMEKDGLFLIEVLDASLVDGRKLTCYEAVLIVVSLLHVPPAVQTVEKVMAVMREMKRVELLMFLNSFLLLRDAERHGNTLRTEDHGKKMVSLWNRVTESTLYELLPDFMLAAFVDPRGTVEHAVDSASEKAGKIGLSCELLARLRPICRLTIIYDDASTDGDQEVSNETEDGDQGDVGDAENDVDEDHDETVHEWSLITDVMYNRIQALSTSPPNVRANLTALAYRLVKDGVLCVLEAYAHFVRPVFGAIVEDFEIGALACRMLEAILEDEAVSERLAEYSLWDVLKFVWIAHQDVLDFEDSGEDGCEDEPVLHLEEKLYGLKKILVGLLSDASDEKWWKFCADAAMMTRLSRFLPMASLCCFNNDDDGEDDESRGTVGGIVREYHKITYMRDEDGICLECNCASCERPFDIATLELAVALNYCHERDVDRFLTRSLVWPASLGETGKVLSRSLSRIDELVQAWSVGTEAMQEKHARTLVRPLLESFKALLAKLPGLESPESERLLGMLAIGFLERVAGFMESWCSSALEIAFVQRALLDMWMAFLDCEQMAELVSREQVEETFVAFWLPLLDKIESRDELSKAVDEMLLRIPGTT